MSVPLARIRSLVAMAALVAACSAQAQTPQQQQHGGSTSVAIVLDDSDSAKKEYGELRNGVLSFVNAFGDDDELCVIGAGGKPHVIHDFSFDPELLSDAVKKARPQGQAAIAEAVQFATARLQSEAANDSGAVVVFVGNEEQAASAEAAIANQETKTPVHVIAAPGTDWRTQERLQRLTATSGGMAYFPSSDKQFREIAVEAGRRIAARPNNPAVAQKVASSKNGAAATKLLASYQQLTVRSIPVADSPKTEDFMGGDNLLLQHLLVERLQRAKVFPEVVDGSNAHVSNTSGTFAEPGRKLEMRARLIEYQRGNRVKRQFTFGGEARMKLQVLMVDAASGQVVQSFEKEGSARTAGIFGGSDESVQAKAMLDLANGVLRELQKQR